MANKLGRDYLRRSAQNQAMLKALREKKLQKRQSGERVLLHKFIKEVYPNYKFYKVHAALIKQLQKVIDGECNRLIIQIPPRTGKQCADETPVLTTKGWKTHGELRPGDYVFSPNGNPVKVLRISEKSDSDWLVSLSNGDNIWCHGNHEWNVELVSNRKKVTWTKSTQELSKRKLWSGKKGKRGCKYLFHLPNIKPLQFNHQDLLVDPYLLGAWLGDGTTGKPAITHHENDREVIDAFTEKGYKVTSVHSINNGTTKVTSFGTTDKSISRLRNELRRIEVETSKHIPTQYIYSSFEQRSALIAGLIDTDGHTDATGRHKISNTNKKIIESVIEILISLGQRPYCSVSEPKLSSSGIQGKKNVYSVTWQPSFEFPIRIPRKKPKRIVSERRRVAIVDIQHLPGGGRRGHCIEVDSPDGLYLVGKNLTPTHNSLLTSKLLPAAYLLAHPDRFVGITSYSAELAEGFSRNARDMYKQAGGVLDPYKQSVNDWATQGGGGLWAAGVGGAITGRSGHLLIIDDPVKNREEAESSRLMEKLWDWYASTLYTRLEPEVGAIVTIQCMTGDTKVTMADGSYKELKDIKVNDTILSWHNSKAVATAVKNHTCQGEDDIFEIKTGSSTVKANERHPFLVEKENGTYEWVKVKDLKVGDRLVASSKLSFDADAVLTDLEAWLLGYMFGDGWITKRTGTVLDKNGKRYSRSGFVTCVAAPKPEAEREKILEAFESLWGFRPKLTRFGYYRTERQEPGKWFTSKGLVGNAKTKRVPDWMYSQPEHVREAFLRGYHEADGAVFSTGTSKGRHTFESCNIDLINDFRQLARGLGYSVTNVNVYEGMIQAPNSPKPVLSRNCNFQFNPWSKCEQEFRTHPIRSIKKIGRDLVYDIEVDKTECFLADGLVSHNTRWSENDMIGQLIENEQNVSEKGRENWTIIDLPALYEDPGSRPKLPEHCEVIPDWRENEGEALCPQRYDEDDYERIREAIGSREFASLYQQRPAPAGGNMFDPSWWQYYSHDTVIPDFDRILLSVDCTFTDANTSDFVVGLVVGQAGPSFYVLDLFREKTDVIGTLAMIARMYKRHQLDGTVIELAASGYAVYQMAKKKVPGLIGFKPEKSKEARAAGIVPVVEAGNVYLPISSPWLDAFISEFSLFPAAKNDDQVDALTMAINYSMQRTAPQITQVTWGRGDRVIEGVKPFNVW